MERECTVCRETLSLDQFNKKKGAKFGCTARCKDCIKKNMLYYEYAGDDKEKTCVDCNKTKTLNNFWKDKRITDGTKGYCINCGKKRNDAYHEKFPERIKFMNKRYYDNNKEKENAKSREWNNANKARVLENLRVWHANNPEKNAMYHNKRRARKANNGGSYTSAEWNELCEIAGSICLCCGKPNEESKLTADHIIPVARGGTSYIDNMQPLCNSCNCKKATKTIDYRPENMCA